MKTKIYQNNQDILIIFDDKNNNLERYGATHISKTTLGAARGEGFDSLKEVSKFVKKHKMKFVTTITLKEYVKK